MRNEPQELTLLNNHVARLKFHSKNLPPTPQTQSNSYGPTGSPGAFPPLTRMACHHPWIENSFHHTACYSLSTILKQNVHRVPREKEVCLTYLL